MQCVCLCGVYLYMYRGVGAYVCGVQVCVHVYVCIGACVCGLYVCVCAHARGTWQLKNGSLRHKVLSSCCRQLNCF